MEIKKPSSRALFCGKNQHFCYTYYVCQSVTKIKMSGCQEVALFKGGR